VYIANLICIHEAWVAHHVAAVRQVNRQHCAAAKLDVRGPMVMDRFVLGRTEIAPKE
jgi:hypothetical protein